MFNPTSSAVDINGWTISDNDSDSHVINNGGSLLVPAGGYLVLGNNADTGTNGGVTVDYVFSGIALANGGDEVVLFDGSLAEVDRVEYDGGPSFPDPNGASMALIDPALDNNVGANWCEASTAYGAGDSGTPGAANDCPVVVPELVINEIMQNPSAVADSSGEWFEVFNPTSSAVDINGWTISDNDSDSHVINNGGSLLVPAGGYLVLGNNADTGTNGGVTVDYVFSGIALANGGDEVVLFDGSLAEVDRVEYDGGPSFPDPNGASMALIDPALDNNVGANWCEASTAYGAGDSGTPGAANDCPVVVPELVINEIMQNPSAVADSSGEWFEVFNPTSSAVDINGWTISDNDSDSHVINNGGSLLVPAGGYLVLGNNADTGTNGGVTVDYVFSGIALANGGDEVVLFDGSLAEVDRVEYDGGPSFPDPNGASMALIDPALDNNVGANWCEASTAYGAGDSGTPGAANNCQCGDPFTPIYDVQGNGAASPLVGTEVAVEGVVVGDFQNNGMDDNGDLNGFHVQDPTGDSEEATSDGVFVYAPGGIDVQVGDVVRVLGTVAEYAGSGVTSTVTELTGVTDLLICGTATVPAPTVLTLPVSAVSDFERYEGMYVTFPQSLVISEYFNFDRFDEIVLTSERHLTPTAEFEPGSTDAAAAAQEYLLDRITLDDGRTAQNPDPAIHPNGADFDLTNLFRGGDTVANVTGVMDYAFDLYRIQPTQGADYTNANPRTAFTGSEWVAP